MTTVYVLGYPKSGTTWLSRLLGDVLDSPVGAVFPPSSGKAIATEGENRKGSHYIRQGHAMPIQTEGGPVVPATHSFAYKNLTDEKIVLVLRDPRDIMVSGAHHWGRALIPYIHCCGKGDWPMPHGGGLVRWVRRWLDLNIHDCLTRYEDLLTDTEGELRRILQKLDLQPVNDLKAVVERQSFAKRRKWTEAHGSSLNYGRDFQLRFLRKGVVGDWKNRFGPEEIALCEEYFGDLIRELGYE